MIVGNGSPPSSALLTQLLKSDAILLCADGGANAVHKLGHRPQAVVGDLDSVDPTLRQAWPETEWIQVDADNTGTDLQKVLRYTQQLGVTAATLTGVTGGRTDHTLWNLSLLSTYAETMDLCIVDDDCLIRLIHESICFDAPKGLKLSLSPLAGRVDGVTTQGLRWPLKAESLIPGRRDGISNEVTDSPVKISTESGQLLLVIQREGEGDDLSLIRFTQAS